MSVNSVYPRPEGASTNDGSSRGAPAAPRGPRAPHISLRHRGLLAAAAVLAFALTCIGSATAARVVVTTEPRTDLRTGPTREHPRVTVLPPGIRLWAEDLARGFYRVRLAPTLTAWVEQGHVRALDRAVPRPPVQAAEDISLSEDEFGTTVSVPLDEPVAFRVRQQIDPPALVLDLFRVRLARYREWLLADDRAVWAVRTRRVADDWSQVVLYLNGRQQRGCRVSQADGQFRLLVRAPYDDPGIAGKVIVIDPGHGGWDNGAIGPTGLREKDVNLRIALQLAAILARREAVPRLLRTADTSVGPPGSPLRVELEARLAASERQDDADFFLSIHNNAVGPGNRRDARGTESYYWTPMSAVPAHILQRHLCARLRTRDRLVGWAQFYVLRSYDVPRVLVECAYISNPLEEQRMHGDEFIVMAALGLADGLEEFFAQAAPGGGVPISAPAPAGSPAPVTGPLLDPSPFPNEPPTLD